MIQLNELIDGLDFMVETEMSLYEIAAHKQMIRQGIIRLKKTKEVIDIIDSGYGDTLSRQDILRMLS